MSHNTYEPNDALSEAVLVYEQLSLTVYETFAAEDSPFCAQHPYVINIELGEMGFSGDYYVFCTSFPALLSVLSTFGPLVRHVSHEDDELRDAMLNAIMERPAPGGEEETEPQDELAGLEEGALDERLIAEDRSSGYADHLVIHAIVHGHYADAKRICDRVEKLLAFDAEVGQAELLYTRGKIAEAQQDLAQAESYYEGAENRLKRLNTDTANDLHVHTLIALGRMARLRGRIDDAEAYLLRAEQGVTAHEAMHQTLGQHECLMRFHWCFETGSIYAARWRSESDEGAYQQAVASFEQAIEVGSDQSRRGNSQIAQIARDMLRDLRRDHGR